MFDSALVNLLLDTVLESTVFCKILVDSSRILFLFYCCNFTTAYYIRFCGICNMLCDATLGRVSQ